MLTVEEVNRQADGKPDEESDPGFEGQAEHEDEAEDDGEYGQKGNPGDAEAAGPFWLGPSEDEDPGAGQHECEEGSDVREIGEGADVKDASGYAD